MLQTHEKYLYSLKASYYSQGNRVGKLLANQLKAKQMKWSIPHLINPKSGEKVFLSKEIANSFRDYYQALYNLAEDPNTPQPSFPSIKDYLYSLALPTMDGDTLQQLNTPITTAEISKVIKCLPNNKSQGQRDYHLSTTKHFKKYYLHN